MLRNNNIWGHAGVFIVNLNCIRLTDIWFSWLFSVVSRKNLDSLISRCIYDHELKYFSGELKTAL